MVSKRVLLERKVKNLSIGNKCDNGSSFCLENGIFQDVVPHLQATGKKKKKRDNILLGLFINPQFKRKFIDVDSETKSLLKNIGCAKGKELQ